MWSEGLELISRKPPNWRLVMHWSSGPLCLVGEFQMRGIFYFTSSFHLFAFNNLHFLLSETMQCGAVYLLLERWEIGCFHHCTLSPCLLLEVKVPFCSSGTKQVPLCVFLMSGPMVQVSCVCSWCQIICLRCSVCAPNARSQVSGVLYVLLMSSSMSQMFCVCSWCRVSCLRCSVCAPDWWRKVIG